MKNVIKYLLEGLIWSAAGTLLTLLFDKDFIIWEALVMWFFIGVVWRLWMNKSSPFRKKEDGTNPTIKN